MSLTRAEQRALLDPDGKRRTGLFNFAAHEVDCATTLLQRGVERPGTPPPTVVDGLTRLFDRGLLAVHTEPGTPDAVAVGWVDPDARATAVRHLIRKYTLGALVGSTIMDRVVQSSTDQFTAVELAMILSWHYRYTDTQTVDIAADGTATVLTEHHHHGAAVTRVFAATGFDVADLDTVGVNDYSDKGDCLSDSALSYFIRALAGLTQPEPGRASVEGGGARGDGVRVNLDTLRTHPAGYQPCTYTETMPAFTQDAAAYFGAPALADRAAFIGWAETALTFTVPCGNTTHRVRVDPHTHELSPYPNTARTRDKQAGEHLLTAFTDTPEPGCEKAATALALFGDQSQYDTAWGNQPASALSAARIISRTVQYLDAGIDLAAAAPFLRVGINAAQCAEMVALQARAPAEARTVLLAWAKFHWNAGPVTVDAAPL